MTRILKMNINARVLSLLITQCLVFLTSTKYIKSDNETNNRNLENIFNKSDDLESRSGSPNFDQEKISYVIYDTDILKTNEIPSNIDLNPQEQIRWKVSSDKSYQLTNRSMSRELHKQANKTQSPRAPFYDDKSATHFIWTQSNKKLVRQKKEITAQYKRSSARTELENLSDFQYEDLLNTTDLSLFEEDIYFDENLSFKDSFIGFGVDGDGDEQKCTYNQSEDATLQQQLFLDNYLTGVKNYTYQNITIGFLSSFVYNKVRIILIR